MEPTLSSSISEALKNKILNNVLRINDDDDPHNEQDICRVCRLAGDDTLYHPCLCTGSIKFVHQDCLMQWLKYSKKDVCELCNHKFSFRPVYRADMPDRLPLYDLVKGVFLIIVRFLRLFLTYCIVTTCWLGIVPLMASRIYRMVFSGLISSFFSLKILNLFSTENVALDIIKGSAIVSIFLCTFISLVWLREQIMIGGAPGFMHLPEPDQRNQEEVNRQEEAPPHVFVPPDDAAANNPNAEDRNIDWNVNQDNVNNANENQPLLPENDAAQAVPAILEEPVVERVVDAALVANNEEAAGVNDIERIVDDFTWQRLLGFDGTFAFIEHVFWTISLNIVFNVLFLHWPAQVGMCLFDLLKYSNRIPYFELPIAILAGYVVIFAVCRLIHEIARVLRINALYTTSAMMYLMLKVFLLIIVEVAIFPIICGWWLDVCSLPLTGATLDARIKTFSAYPSSSMFLHWLVGMIYVFYSASFILVLRELLRPGVLWFIRNLNDPEFNPVIEMIQQPLTRHFRRLVASTTLFFTIILLVVYFPLRLISFFLPRTLPYAFTATADTPLGELSLELILLQIVMPTVLEYSKAFSILKKIVEFWCRVVGGWLKLDSFLLPRRLDDDTPVPQPRPNNDEDLALNNADREAAAHDNNLVVDEEAVVVEEGDLENIDLHTSDNDQADYNTDSIQANDGVENVETDIVNENLLHNNEANEEEIFVQNIENNLRVEEPEYQENLPDIQPQPPVQPAQVQQVAQQQRQRQENHLAARHQALLMMRDMNDYEDYEHPDMFVVRIIALLICLALTAIAISFLLFLVPVSIGRLLFSLITISATNKNNILGQNNGVNTTNQNHHHPIHDLYTVAAGLYFCWLFSKVWMVSYEWFQKGWDYVCKVFRSTAWLVLRLTAGAIPLLIVIPFMFGLYFQLLVVGPLRVSINQTPLFFPWKEWAMGVVHFKIFCASVLMGPDWWLKAIYAGGIRGFELKYLYVNLIIPLVNFISLQISLPYVGSKIVLHFLDLSHEDKIVLTRYTYPCTLITVGIVAFLFWQWQKLKNVAQKIRNDKYLIGTQLVNFYRENAMAAIESTGFSSFSNSGNGGRA